MNSNISFIYILIIILDIVSIVTQYQIYSIKQKIG